MCEYVMVPRELLERYVSSVEGHGYGFDGDEEIRTLLDKPAMRQGEPVAWRIPVSGSWFYDTKREACEREYADYRSAFTAEELAEEDTHAPEPLYTNADPAEVERLAILLRQTQVKHAQERDALRAQLAERDALLRDVQAAMREYEQGCDQFPPFHHNQLMERIDAALSASAVPSAPKVKIRVPEGLVNCIEGNRVFRSDEKLVLFRPEEFGAVGDGVTDDTEAFRACVEAAAQFANPAELTDEQIIEVMHTHLNNADGGYVVDTAPEDVVKAGRALLACAGRSAPVEPVVWLTKCKQSGLVEQAEPNEKASNPEHWTDAFPVYDSPKSARSQFDYDRGFAAGTAESETLRAKLAERDALLEDLKGKTILSWADKHRIGAALERKP